MMPHDQFKKLWVTKFCIKLIYPTFNINLFLVFLAIKYRLFYKKADRIPKMFMVKTVPVELMVSSLEEKDSTKVNLIASKCLIISQKVFQSLAVENPFMVDGSVLWMMLKLDPYYRKLLLSKQAELKRINYDLTIAAETIHKTLWNKKSPNDVNSERVVPLLGLEFVPDDTIFVSENEKSNIAHNFNVKQNDDAIKLCLKSIPQNKLPKIASTIEVHLILNQFDLSNEFIKEVLNNYFSEPKLLNIDDVFGIELTPVTTMKFHYKYYDVVNDAERLYFKCGHVEFGDDTDVSAFFVIKGVTKLTLGEAVHSLLPTQKYLKTNNKVNVLEFYDICPGGLRKQFEDINAAIQPFISSQDYNQMQKCLVNPILPMFLVTGCLGSKRHILVNVIAKYNGLNTLVIDCNAISSSTSKQTESKISSIIQKCKASAPVIVLLDNFEVFAVDADNNEDSRIVEYFTKSLTELYLNYTKHPIIFFAVTEAKELKPNIMRIFLEKFQLAKPSKDERLEILEWYFKVMGLKLGTDRDKNNTTAKGNDGSGDKVEEHGGNNHQLLERISAKTRTFACGDIDTLVHLAIKDSYLKQNEMIKSCDLYSEPDIQLLNEENFESALEKMRELKSQNMDAPKIPKVHWEDIGGLEKLKKELMKTIEFPIKYPHLFKNSSLKRSGILLYGPPGCGKTLVAKAVSTELNVSFLSVKGPELLNMYIGQSEENVRKVFEAARASSPCIVFLDELDALAPRRGAAGDSGGASDRVVSQLLAELDGVTAGTGDDADGSSFVLVMGATNRPDLLEQSLLRPGRLDKLIYVAPYCGQDEKTKVLTALCRSYNMAEDVNLQQVALELPDRCTGADLLQVVSIARSAAVRQTVRKLQAGELKESELSSDSLVITMEDVWEGVTSFRPSVTDEELLYYESLQRNI